MFVVGSRRSCHRPEACLSLPDAPLLPLASWMLSPQASVTDVTVYEGCESKPSQTVQKVAEAWKVPSFESKWYRRPPCEMTRVSGQGERRNVSVVYGGEQEIMGKDKQWKLGWKSHCTGVCRCSVFRLRTLQNGRKNIDSARARFSTVVRLLGVAEVAVDVSFSQVKLFAAGASIPMCAWR